MKHRRFLITSALAVLLGLGVGAGVSIKKAEVKSAKADYTNTIRVYVDLTWDGISEVRIGTDQTSGDAFLSSSDAKYNQSLGKYVRDISTTSNYNDMGCFFIQNGTWWFAKDNGGYIPRSGGFSRGKEYQIKGISHAWDSGSNKAFNYEVYEIGDITDNVSNATIYFVDGNSWHLSGDVYAYFWGGTASCASYPGEVMTDSGMRLKAYVGDTEYTLNIYKYTISGSTAYVQFNNNSSKTRDLRPVNDQVYFYGVSAETFGGVAQLLVTLHNQLGSYTYNGRTFTESICKLTQSQASSFIAAYDDFDTHYGDGVKDSVEGSGLVTYTDPEHNTTSTGLVTLTEIREALVKKYPTLGGGNGRIMIFQSKEQFNSTIVIVIIAGVALAAIGGYFFLRKRKAD